MKIVRVMAIAALALLGMGAAAGGAWLMADPSGGTMHMPMRFLEHSPFHSFFYPGVVLLVTNGVPPLLILAPVIRRSPGYGWWVTFQGCVLLVWITVEVMMLREVSWPHYLYWGWGLLLIALGLVLRPRSGKA